MYSYFNVGIFGEGIEEALIASNKDLIWLSLVEDELLEEVEFDESDVSINSSGFELIVE